MLEFYSAYMDVNGMMNFAEAMLKESVQKATGGSLQVKYADNEIDFSKFERLTMKEAVSRVLMQDFEKYLSVEFDQEWLEDPRQLFAIYSFVKNNQWNSFLDIYKDESLEKNGAIERVKLSWIQAQKKIIRKN